LPGAVVIETAGSVSYVGHGCQAVP